MIKVVIILLIVIIIVLWYKNTQENLCLSTKFGEVTDVPLSTFVNANMALVHSTSLGQAPLGDSRFWTGDESPVTQGMYANENEQNWITDDADAYGVEYNPYYPVYTEKPFGDY